MAGKRKKKGGDVEEPVEEVVDDEESLGDEEDLGDDELDDDLGDDLGDDGDLEEFDDDLDEDAWIGDDEVEPAVDDDEEEDVDDEEEDAEDEDEEEEEEEDEEEDDDAEEESAPSEESDDDDDDDEEEEGEEGDDDDEVDGIEEELAFDDDQPRGRSRKKAKAKAKPRRSRKANSVISPRARLDTPEGAKRAWANAIAKVDTGSARAYKVSDAMEPGDVISHKLFGVGIVHQKLGPTKSEVLFEDGLKKLVCNLQN